MVWTIEYEEVARRQLRKLDRQAARRIVDFLDHRLAGLEDPRALGQALHGRLKAYWRYRVGDYRIICELQDGQLVVLVVGLGNRREVYRRR